MTDALLPCPFCGGKAERIDIDDGDNAGGSCVHCTQCDASSNVEFEFKENFVSNWNRRVGNDALAEQDDFILKFTDISHSGDWACAQCKPYSDMIKEGFVCGYHRAESRRKPIEQ